MKHIINKKQVVQIIVKKHFTVPLTRGTIHKTHDKKGSLSNGVDDLENFTSEMEWSFFVPVGFSCVFSKWYSYVSTPPAFPLAWIHV